MALYKSVNYYYYYYYLLTPSSAVQIVLLRIEAGARNVSAVADDASLGASNGAAVRLDEYRTRRALGPPTTRRPGARSHPAPPLYPPPPTRPAIRRAPRSQTRAPSSLRIRRPRRTDLVDQQAECSSSRTTGAVRRHNIT